ncbi:MAG: hypothetical protein P4L35_03175 [Ignavibacteriaceae bacterium]|nr:hypothetical protein [Ignavibacteriaceae bacterium]
MKNIPDDTFTSDDQELNDEINKLIVQLRKQGEIVIHRDISTRVHKYRVTFVIGKGGEVALEVDTIK